jgi:hypothetical protein
MAKAKRVHSTPRKTAFKIVAGTDFAAQPPEANAQEPPPAQPKRKARGPYKDRRAIAYQDGLPVIDPAKEEDRIFFEIARHSAARQAYTAAVAREFAAEGNVFRADFERLQGETARATQDMMLYASCLVMARPETRAGLIAQAKYLEEQFEDDGECTYMPEDIAGEPWPKVFLGRLALSLRKIGKELPPAKRSRRRKAVRS